MNSVTKDVIKDPKESYQECIDKDSKLEYFYKLYGYDGFERVKMLKGFVRNLITNILPPKGHKMLEWNFQGPSLSSEEYWKHSEEGTLPEICSQFDLDMLDMGFDSFERDTYCQWMLESSQPIYWSLQSCIMTLIAERNKILSNLRQLEAVKRPLFEKLSAETGKKVQTWFLKVSPIGGSQLFDLWEIKWRSSEVLESDLRDDELTESE